MSATTQKVTLSHRWFNPNYFHLRREMNDTDVRFIFLKGGSSSSKSYSVAQALIIDTLRSGSSALILRKVGASIKNSIYEDFKAQIERFNLSEWFTCLQNTIRCINGARLDFSGLDDSEKIKGIAGYKRVVLEELTEFDVNDFKQIRKRLRGKAGQQIISMFNPISENHWIKTELFDNEQLAEVDNHLRGIVRNSTTGEILPVEYTTVKKKFRNSTRSVFNPRTNEYDEHPADMVIIESTYLNNFWVIGSPDGKYGYYDRQTVADFEKDKEKDYDYYRVYALGDWGSIKTGGEFWWAFDNTKHRTKEGYNPNLPIHITIDNNALPYISIGFWQTVEAEGRYIDTQIHEIAARDPFNTVTKAAEMAVKYLNDIDYSDKLFLYGDQTTKANNTIDDEKRSFFDKFKEKLEEGYIVEDRMPKSNPSVSMTGEFINAIYSGDYPGIEVRINENCKISIDDYNMTKKDVNGGILKKRIKDKLTGQSYEEYGHFSDTKRYFIAELHKEAYTQFSLRRKHNKTSKDEMKYFNSKTEQAYTKRVFMCSLDCNGKFISFICDVGEYVDIHTVSFSEEFNKDLIADKIKKANPSYTIVECCKQYFPIVREFRELGLDVRVMSEQPNKLGRIEAHKQIISDRFRYASDYDTSSEYTSFVENILDYDGKNNYEAITCLSAIARHLNREGLV